MDAAESLRSKKRGRILAAWRRMISIYREKLSQSLRVLSMRARLLITFSFGALRQLRFLCQQRRATTSIRVQMIVQKNNIRTTFRCFRILTKLKAKTQSVVFLHRYITLKKCLRSWKGAMMLKQFLNTVVLRKSFTKLSLQIRRMRNRRYSYFLVLKLRMRHLLLRCFLGFKQTKTRKLTIGKLSLLSTSNTKKLFFFHFNRLTQRRKKVLICLKTLQENCRKHCWRIWKAQMTTYILACDFSLKRNNKIRSYFLHHLNYKRAKTQEIFLKIEKLLAKKCFLLLKRYSAAERSLKQKYAQIQNIFFEKVFKLFRTDTHLRSIRRKKREESLKFIVIINLQNQIFKRWRYVKCKISFINILQRKHRQLLSKSFRNILLQRSFQQKKKETTKKLCSKLSSSFFEKIGFCFELLRSSIANSPIKPYVDLVNEVFEAKTRFNSLLLKLDEKPLETTIKINFPVFEKTAETEKEKLLASLEQKYSYLKENAASLTLEVRNTFKQEIEGVISKLDRLNFEDV